MSSRVRYLVQDFSNSRAYVGNQAAKIVEKYYSAWLKNNLTATQLKELALIDPKWPRWRRTLEMWKRCGAYYGRHVHFYVSRDQRHSSWRHSRTNRDRWGFNVRANKRKPVGAKVSLAPTAQNKPVPQAVKVGIWSP
jgi:hypothetical protein